MHLPTRSSRFWVLASMAIGIACGFSVGARAQEEATDPHTVMLAKGHFEKGMRLLAKEDAKQGEAELLEAVRIFPDFADAHIQLGNAAMRRKDYSEGLDRYLRAQTALANLQGLARRQEMERRRRLQESIDIVQERIDTLQLSQRPGDAAQVDREMVKLERLQQELSKSMPGEGTPFPAELHFLIGNARMNLERFDEAIQDYRRALGLRPNYGEVHNNLAVIYLYRKDYASAWEHLHAAEKAGIRINPQFREELAAVAPEPPPSD